MLALVQVPNHLVIFLTCLLFLYVTYLRDTLYDSRLLTYFPLLVISLKNQ